MRLASPTSPTATGEPRGAPAGPAEIRETHTGIVALVGERAFKVKKPVKTDFLDFSTPARREHACAREVQLNSRLAADSYLGISHLAWGDGAAPEPVIVMRRYPDDCRLATMIRSGTEVSRDLQSIAATLAAFHAGAERNGGVDADGGATAVAARWEQNLLEMQRYVGRVVEPEALHELQRLVRQFMAGRTALFAQRVADGRIVDGHGDLLADDIFCLRDGPVLLDCLDFDDHLRFVDGADDAAFLAMDLEFLGRRDLGDYFLDEYARCSTDPAPTALIDFYVAYRAVVRAKVDCIRVDQGHPEAVVDARRHLEIATERLRRSAPRLILIGGGPGTGKTTLSRALAEQIGAQVISTDDVRREMAQSGKLHGDPGVLDAGLYSPDSVAAVYDAVLGKAQAHLAWGRTVILDGTWRDSRQRHRARQLAHDAVAPLVELSCVAALNEAQGRIASRTGSTSDATPQIAEAITGTPGWPGAHQIDTARPLADSVAEAHQVCYLAV